MLLEGDLGLTERVPLELHVNACDGCQRRLAHLQELRELEQRARPAPRPVHWRPILAPGFVVKALGAIRAEDVTTRLRRLVAEKVPSRQLAVAAAVPLLVMLAVFIFERGFTVGSGMRQRPAAAPAETRGEAPVVPPVASIAPTPPTIATPVVPTRMAPPPAVVTQPVPAKPPAVVTQPVPAKPPAVVTQPVSAKPPAVVTQPAPAKPTPPADKPRSAETKVAARAPEAKAIDVKSAPRAARSESGPKDEKASPPVASPAPAKTAVANGSSGSHPRVAAAQPSPNPHTPIKAAETTTAPPSRRGMVDVVGRLQVKSRTDAERDLTALFARAGGTAVNRQRGPSGTVLEAGVPQANYVKFSQGITRIGSWRVEAERSPLPPIVQVSVRLAE